MKKGASRKGTRKKTPNRGSQFRHVAVAGLIAVVFLMGLVGFFASTSLASSSFFSIRTIDVFGAERTPESSVVRVVSADRKNIWDVDLEEIRVNLEGMKTVRRAAVSRVLPDTIRVDIVERTPVAAVRLGDSLYWADDEAVLIAKVRRNETRPDFFLVGWDRGEYRQAIRSNKRRVQMFESMADEWSDFGMSKRVHSVDMTETSNVVASVSSSEGRIPVEMGNRDFGARMRRALEALAAVEGTSPRRIVSKGGQAVVKGVGQNSGEVYK